MDNWTPPKNGSPCWVEIPATDVARAKTFYSTVFDWKFKEVPASSPYTADKIAMFQFPDPKLDQLGGGITKMSEDCIKKGKGGVVVHLYVDNIENMIEAIKKAGGTPVGEKESESDQGWMHAFEDTEGNTGGIYTMKTDKKEE